MPIFVSIFDYRIEIISPRKLYGDMTVEQMLKGKTERRNLIIGRIFAIIHISEGWGRGITGLIEECKEHDLKESLFEGWGDDFNVTLYRKPIITEVPIPTEELTGVILDVYNVFASNPNAFLIVVVEILSTSPSTVKRYVAELKEKGRLVRVGGSGLGTRIVK